MGPPGYGRNPSVRPGLAQSGMDQSCKRPAPQQIQQVRQQAVQNRNHNAKKKMADKILPQRIRELVPESQAYMDLLAFERKLDQTIMRKRLDIQEALKRPIKVTGKHQAERLTGGDPGPHGLRMENQRHTTALLGI